MEDALYVLKSYPLKYLGSVFRAFRIYFFPSSDWFHIYSSIDNVGKIKTVEMFYDVLLYGQFFGFSRPEPLTEHIDEYFYSIWNIGLFLLAGFLISVIYGVFVIFRELKKKTYDSPLFSTVLFFLITIGYVTVVSNCLEVGENERFRFNIDPMLLVLFGVFLTNVIVGIRRRYSIEQTVQKENGETPAKKRGRKK